MELKITAELRAVWKQSLAQLSGAARRMFMASVVKGLGRGGALQAQVQLGWDRTTLRKGLHELKSGIVCIDAVAQRGRKPLEARLSNLEADLRAIGEAASQTDPTFRTTQLYRRLTAGEARRRLVEELSYDPATVHRINREADADAGTIRLSLDTKTVVPIGQLSRGGKSRQAHQALDHDLEPDLKLTPFGLHRPDTAQTWLSFTTGSATADFMVDRLSEIWPTLKKTVILHIPSS
jgi:hypothetical protein